MNSTKSSEDKSITMDDLEKVLVTDTNILLRCAGITKNIIDVNELSRVASSVFVAIFEGLFQLELSGVRRVPTTTEDYIHNAQCVIDGLSTRIKMDLRHITGDSIVSGDVRSISNLANILLRIVNITQSKISRKGGGRGGILDEAWTQFIYSDSEVSSTPQEELDKGLKDDSDSSAEDSDSIPSDPAQTLRTKQRQPVPSGLQYLRLSADDVRDLVTMDTRRAVLRIKRIMLQESKLEDAKSRREWLQRLAVRKCGVRNRRKEEVSMRAWQRRWLQDLEGEERSFQLRRSLEDTVVLQKIYKAHLRRLNEWRIEEQKQVRDSIEQVQRDNRLHIESLQKLFEDRMRLLSEGGRRLSGGANKMLGESREKARLLRQSFLAGKEKAVKVSQEDARQDRQRQLHLRRDAHKALLSVLSSEDWMETLH